MHGVMLSQAKRQAQVTPTRLQLFVRRYRSPRCIAPIKRSTERINSSVVYQKYTNAVRPLNQAILAKTFVITMIN